MLQLLLGNWPRATVFAIESLKYYELIDYYSVLVLTGIYPSDDILTCAYGKSG